MTSKKAMLMQNRLLIVLSIHLLVNTLSLGAIKPTRSFVDFLNRTEWHAYSKQVVHTSITRNAATALIAGSATCYLAKKHLAKKSEDTCKLVRSEGSSNYFGNGRVGWVGVSALLAACVATKSSVSCCRLCKIIKAHNMPTVRSEPFQASLAQGMQPDSYYWVSKPLKNLFWS